MRRDGPSKLDEPPRHANGGLTDLSRGNVAMDDTLPKTHLRRRDAFTQQLPRRRLPTRESRLDRDLTHEPDLTESLRSR